MKKQPTINPNDFVSVESGSEDVYIPLNEEIEVYDVDKALDDINGVVVAGSTEDKVEYLDETKTDIREAIINKGVDVGEDDPFRLYAEKIGEIEGGEINNQDKTITENGTYTADAGYTGLGTVVVNTPVVNNENKTIRINGTYTAGAGYTGLGEVVVDVADIPAVVEPLSVSPTTSQQIITPPANVDGFNQVTVGAVTSSIDENITAGNIKSGVSILGVQGNVVELDGETTTVSPTTSQQVITPTGQHNGLTEVTIEAVDASIDSDIVEGNIKSGVNILGVSGSVVELNADSLSVTPTTSAQTITPTSPYNAFNEVSVSAVTSSIDSNIAAGNIKSGVSILGVSGNVVELNGGTASVTPTTSSQVITPTSPVNGFTRIEVDAVDSNIDANITSANIVDGVSILGVTGSAEVLDGEQITITPTTSQQVITPSGNHNGIIEATVSAVTSAIDSNISAGNIKSGVSILGVNGSVVEANETTLNVTPSTSAQTLTPTGAYTGFDEVNVSAVTSSIDANITAGNIKDGVTILGVQGTYTGGGITPTGTKNITVNGVYDITNYASVDVAVPTTAPAYYIPKAVDANGELVNSGSYLIDFTNINSIGLRALSYAYMGVSFAANTAIDMGSVVTLKNAACEYAFYGCSGITTVDMSSITTIPNSGCKNMFSQSSITSIDMSSVETVGYMGCSAMCTGCIGITYANFGLLRTFGDSSAFDGAFNGCSSLASIDVSSVEDVNKNYVFRQAFSYCSALTTVRWSSLTEVTGDYAFSGAFGYSGITSLFFPSLSSTGFGTKTNQFQSMVNRVSGCTVHFPSNLQSVIGSWSDVQNGFNGINTTVLFDLPATVTLVGTNSYYRNPKYDTATALAWFDTSATRATPYYTSGTTDPVVNDAIYSDASCTTQVDTIASIS